MRPRWILGLLVAASLSWTACATHARRDMLVTTGWTAANLAKSKVVVLQVGPDRKSYDAAHVPGAQFVPLEQLMSERNGVPNELPDDIALVHTIRRLGLDRRKRIVLYDDVGGLFAARAWFTLDFLGLGNRAALLDGGWTKWTAEGRPVTAAIPPPRKPTSYKPRMPHDVIVTMPEVREISHAVLAGSPRYALLDARPEPDFLGKSGGVPRLGHIPGARNLYWRDALASDANPVVRPEADLRALFAAAGVGPKTQAVTYCRTGVQGAYDFFLLKYLGYDARLYDGSFVEWSGARDTSVATGPAQQVSGDKR